MPALLLPIALLPAACATIDRAPERARMIASIRAAAQDVPALRDDPMFAVAVAVAAEARMPREAFLPRRARCGACVGAPLSIGWNQTISDPYVMAIMTAATRITEGSRVLEIGTGSGYQAALLVELGAKVWTIEIVSQLASRASAVLRRRGYRGITVRHSDGFAGWADRAPFDAVIVTAGSATVPQPLLDQLRIGGRLVMPIGPSTATEHLEVYTKAADGHVDRCSLGWAMFVPLTGRGFTPDRPGLSRRTPSWCFGAPVT